MSRPVTGRDAVSPLPDRRVFLDEAGFGLGQQRQGFVELPLLESVAQRRCFGRVFCCQFSP